MYFSSPKKVSAKKIAPIERISVSKKDTGSSTYQINFGNSADTKDSITVGVDTANNTLTIDADLLKQGDGEQVVDDLTANLLLSLGTKLESGISQYNRVCAQYYKVL